MKAIVKTRKEPGVEVLDVKIPEIGGPDILVKTAAGSLCGSDVHYYEWLPGSQFLPVPVILGHEFSGEVVEVGAEVKSVVAGDRISALPTMPCSRCANCRTGRADRCLNRLTAGLTSDGFFAEYVRLTAGADIFKLPDNVGYESAAMLEPLSVALNAVDVSGFKMGWKTAVLGPGPIGLLALKLLKAGGASLVIMAGTSSDAIRFEAARKAGADFIIDVDKEDLAGAARERAGGRLDVVFEATGNPRVIAQALDMVRNGGAVVLIGIHSGPAQFDPTPMVRGRKNLISAYTYDTGTWARSLNLLSAGVVEVESLISHRLKLEQAELGFELAIKKEAVKVIFIP